MITEVDIKEYRYRPMPTPPDEVIRYCKEKIKDPRHKMADDFWRKAIVADWFNQHSKWQAEMKSHHDYLEAIVKEGSAIAKANLAELKDKIEEWWAFGFDLVREIASHNIRYGTMNTAKETE
jgi:catalase (peroxidase I)